MEVRYGAVRPKACGSTDIGAFVVVVWVRCLLETEFWVHGGAPCAGPFWRREAGSVQFYRHWRSGGGGLGCDLVCGHIWVLWGSSVCRSVLAPGGRKRSVLQTLARWLGGAGSCVGLWSH